MFGRQKGFLSINHPLDSFCSLLLMQNGLNLSQLLLRLLMKFGGKVQKIFLTQPFGLG